jgi:hypothetical protein
MLHVTYINDPLADSCLAAGVTSTSSHLGIATAHEKPVGRK